MLKYNVPGMDAFTSCGITDERDQKAIYTRVRRARSKEVEEECAATLASWPVPNPNIPSTNKLAKTDTHVDNSNLESDANANADTTGNATNEPLRQIKTQQSNNYWRHRQNNEIMASSHHQ